MRYKDVQIIAGKKAIAKMQKKQNSPLFQGVKLYDEYSCAVMMRKRKVVLGMLS